MKYVLYRKVGDPMDFATLNACICHAYHDLCLNYNYPEAIYLEHTLLWQNYLTAGYSQALWKRLGLDIDSLMERVKYQKDPLPLSWVEVCAKINR